MTEPKLCSRLELWLRVGDVPWITRTKWPQMQRSISWWEKVHEVIWDSAIFPWRQPLGPAEETVQGALRRWGGEAFVQQGSDTLSTGDGAGSSKSPLEAGRSHNRGVPGFQKGPGAEPFLGECTWVETASV